MKSPLFVGTSCPQKRSAVLVVVLALLVFLSLIIVSLALALQTETQAAHYYAARSSADLLAQQGIEYVRAALVTAEQPTNAWVTAPGHIYYWPTNSILSSSTTMDLSSGSTNAAANGIYAPPDLNRLILSEDSLTAITASATAEPITVGWIYVRQSGYQETNQVPVINSTDPIIGRFAYWTDDESSRIDLNTAYAVAGNTNSMNHPSRIDLTSLFGLNYAQEIYTNALTACFNSPDDARRLDPNLSSMISTNRFSLTHYAYNQNLNPWGQPKIILTTQQKVAGTNNGVANTNFFDILTTPNTDPGFVANINQAKLSSELLLLNGLLSSNWPSFAGASFAQKFKPWDTATPPIRITQLSLDIIDYVRAVETTNTLFPEQPIRGDWSGTTFQIGQRRQSVLRRQLRQHQSAPLDNGGGGLFIAKEDRINLFRDCLYRTLFTD